jgi:hypothetical protein
VEGYKKTDPPAKIAARFAELVLKSAAADGAKGATARESSGAAVPGTPGHTLLPSLSTAAPKTASSGTRDWSPRPPRRPEFVGAATSVSFPIKAGRVWIDPAAWKAHAAAIVSRSGGLLKDEAGRPALTVKPEEFLAKDSDMIAAEVECRRGGIDGLFVELDIAGLDAPEPR